MYAITSLRQTRVCITAQIRKEKKKQRACIFIILSYTPLIEKKQQGLSYGSANQECFCFTRNPDTR